MGFGSAVEVFFKALLDDGQLQVDAKKAGDKMGQRIGDSLSSKLKGAIAGAGIGTAFVGAVDAATKFQDQLATINTVAKVSDDQLQKIGDDIQELSRKTGKTTDDLTQGFYDLVSAGVPADKAMQTLNDSAVLAIGSLGSTAEAVDLVTSALGAYNMDASQSARVTDIFAQAVADGKTTVAALAGGISQVAPIAASAGVSLEEVAAATAIMTLKGDTASQAMTRIKNAIAALLTPNAALNAIQERTGINFAKLAEEKGLAVALEELRKATKGNNEEFAKALGSSEALTLAFSVTGDNAAAMADELAAVKGGADKGGVALEQFGIKSKSAAEQGKRLAAQIQTFIQDVGGPFVNSVGPAVFALNQLGGAFGKGGIAAKLFGAVIGGLTGSVLPGLKDALAKAFVGAEIGTRAETLGLKLQTALIKGLTVKDRIVDAVGLLWEKVLYSGPVQKMIGLAGTAAGAVYAAAVKVSAAVGDALAAVWSKAIALPVVGAAIQAAAAAAAGLFWAAAAAAAIALPAIVFLAVIKLVDDNGLPGVSDSALGKQQKAFLDDLKARGEQGGAAIGDATAKAQSDAWVSASAEFANRQGKQAAGAVVDKYGDEMIARGKKVGSDFAAQMLSHFAEVNKLGPALVANAKRLANLAGLATAQAIRQQRDTVDQAWNDMLDGLKEATSVTGRTAHLLGLLASKELIKGLHSADPAVRAQARGTKQLILDELAALKPRAGTLSKEAMDNLKKAMKSKDPDIRTAATAIYNAAIHGNNNNGPANLPAKGTQYGSRFIENVIRGMNSQQKALALASAGLAGIARDHFQLSSPAKVGPWSRLGGPEGWGKRFGMFLTKGIRHSIAAVGPLIDHAFDVPAFRAPQLASVGGGFASAVAGGGVTNIYNTTANVEGLVKARNPLEIANQLGRYARTGKLTREPR